MYKFFKCHALSKQQVKFIEKMSEKMTILQILNQSIMVSIPPMMAGYQLFSIGRHGKGQKRLLQLFENLVLPEAEYFLLNFFNLYESFIIFK